MAKKANIKAKRSPAISIEDCALYFYNDPRENRYTNDYLFPDMDDRFKRNIPNAIWEEWRTIVRSNIDNLIASNNFNEICEKLGQLKIKGIGSEAIISTAAQIAYKYELPIDDSCWNIGFLQKASVIKLLKLHSGKNVHIADFLCEHILHFGDLDLTTQVMCIVANTSIIKQTITSLRVE